MVFIGNDIVHLNHPANAEVNLSARYLNKSYALSEQQTILKSADPIIELWKHWSCKEAAFKTLQKMGVLSRFEPKKLEVFSLGNYSRVRYAEHLIYCHTRRINDSLVTIASNCNNGLGSIEWTTENGSEQTESERVRTSLLNSLSNQGLNFSLSAIKKNEQNIPFLQEHPSIDISFSHDYGLVSAAYFCR